MGPLTTVDPHDLILSEQRFTDGEKVKPTQPNVVFALAALQRSAHSSALVRVRTGPGASPPGHTPTRAV